MASNKDEPEEYFAPNEKSEALAEVEAAAVKNAEKTLQENLDDLAEQRKV